MAKNIRINLVVDDKGTIRQVGQAAKGAGKDMEVLSNTAHSTDRRLKGASQQSGNTTKNFSKMAQGITGGLVPAYAILAASVFAVSAAFRFFEQAANFKILQEAQTAFAASTGQNLRAITGQLQTASDGMLRFEQAAQAAAIGAAKGFTTNDLVSLTEGARKASAALGRSFEDTFDRLIRGVSKAEPELLDELGITLRLEEATRKYATSVGKARDELTTYEKSLAVLQETQRQLDDNFGAIDLEGIENPFTKLQKTFDDMLKTVTQAILPAFEAIANVINRSVGAAIAVFGALAVSVLKSMGPVFNLEEGMASFQARTQEAMDVAKNKINEVEQELVDLKSKADDLVIDAAVETSQTSEEMLSRSASGATLAKVADDPLALTGRDIKTLERSLESAEKQYREHGKIRTGIFKGEDIKMVRGFVSSIKKMQSANISTTQRIGIAYKKMQARLRLVFMSIKKAAVATAAATVRAFGKLGRGLSNALGKAGAIGTIIFVIEMLRELRTKVFDMALALTGMIDDLLNAVLNTGVGQLLKNLIANLIEGFGRFVDFTTGSVVRLITGIMRDIGETAKMIPGFGDAGDSLIAMADKFEGGFDKAVDKSKELADGIRNVEAGSINTTKALKESDFGKFLEDQQNSALESRKLTDSLSDGVDTLKNLNQGLEETSQALKDLEKDTSRTTTEFEAFMRTQRTITTSGFGNSLKVFAENTDKVSGEALREMNTAFQKLGELGGPEFEALVTKHGKITRDNLEEVRNDIIATEKASAKTIGTFKGLEESMKDLSRIMSEEGGFAQKGFTDIKRTLDLVNGIVRDQKAVAEDARRAGLDSENFFLKEYGVDASIYQEKLKAILESMKKVEDLQKRINNRTSLGGLLSGGSKQDNQNAIKVLQAQKALAEAQSRRLQLEDQKASDLGFDKAQEEELRVLIEQIPQLATALDRVKKEIKDTTKIGLQLGKGLEDGFTTAFQSIIQGTENMKQAFGKMAQAILKDLAALITRMFVLRTLQAAFGGTSAGNFLGISGPPGASPPTDTSPGSFAHLYGGGKRYGSMPEMALGGIARGPHAGYPAVLHGTEAVIPMPNGKSIPVEFAGGSSTANNVNVSVVMSGSGDNAQTTSDEEGGRRIGSVIAAAVQEELQKQRRPGGILSPYGGAG